MRVITGLMYFIKCLFGTKKIENYITKVIILTEKTYTVGNSTMVIERGIGSVDDAEWRQVQNNV